MCLAGRLCDCAYKLNVQQQNPHIYKTAGEHFSQFLQGALKTPEAD